MKRFMDENFLLNSKTAEKLYHDHAEALPIIDYHCHLSPREIAEDRKYRSMTELWLGGDHYKWRAMRTNGIDEKYITGDAGDKEKFLKWAETVPACIGNPLYHWTHLELRRYFGIEGLLSPETAEELWEKCNSLLYGEAFSARALIRRSKVKVLCTTDDPADSLEFHAALAADSAFDVRVLPAFRPDKALNIEKEGFQEWVGRLGQVSSMEIQTYDDLKRALGGRLEYFHSLGCRLSDHALDPIVFRKGTDEEAAAVFTRVMEGEKPTGTESEKYKTSLLLFLGREYARRNWVMQLHIGTIRNINNRMMELLGPDSGFDAIGDYRFAQALSKMLDALDRTGELPKTILYCLNPGDNEVLATIMGCFQGGGIPGKLQFGSGWWFNDQKDGMTRQITALSNLGLLSRFVGMLTDSRSFLSYVRHEYFRRLLCDILGGLAEKGEAPDDSDLLGKMVKDICYHNAEHYFLF